MVDNPRPECVSKDINARTDPITKLFVHFKFLVENRLQEPVNSHDQWYVFYWEPNCGKHKKHLIKN